MGFKSKTGFDAQGQRITQVSSPTDAADAVPKGFIRYDMPAFCQGKPGSSEIIASWVIPSDLTAGVTLPTNLLGSNNRATSGATASAAWTLTRIPAGSATETVLATLTFAANGTVAAYSAQAAVTLLPGDILNLRAPSSVDGTLADIRFVFVAVR